ncbi:MAG: glycogen/starch/alpha-glucan phosphorylase [Acidobacteria bacterium]|nr:glycogen/starch/alpha-glucan phosphorylase [Acidobacteriota bacterium]MBV9475512.1 glycogen/starch/alpha-glucan phosphorylase [Acidobacteriota bacterium]
MRNERTIPKPKPGGLDPASIIDAFAHRMMYSVARDEFNATDENAFQALAYATRDRLMDRWFKTQDAYYRDDVKRVYYLSLEFLLGRLLVSNMISLGAKRDFVEAMDRLGFRLDSLAERESDAGLGNGGLGRLAACFLDSASTLALPFYGYGIRYEYGIFRQRIRDGQQFEAPDNWLRYGNPWEVARPDVLFPVKFYGRVESYTDEQGRSRMRWVDAETVYAMAYDVAIPGYHNDIVNTLRLWAAKSSREFDLDKFNAGAYIDAVQDKTSSENISKVLYPKDDVYAGRELRLKQQYFFTSATIQDVIRRFRKQPERQWQELPDKVAIQLNDTHPSIAIPETMRVLVDEHAIDWDTAWWLCQRVFAYTNHTVLPEALESWSTELMGKLLPRHLQIVQEIDRRFRAAIVVAHPGDDAKLKRMAIIDDGAQSVRMANLAIVGSHSVNGVARLHTDILTSRIFPDFHAFFPKKFNNKTNGITPRRWLLQSNPELSALITSAIADAWPADLAALRGLEAFADDTSFRERWRAVKLQRKEALVRWLRLCHQLDADPESLFDIQIKRMHEYKRQLLNVMHVIALHHRLADGDDAIAPRTVIFGGKAAPSYYIAKLFIQLIHAVAAMVRANPNVARKLNVVFVPNYDVSAAELLFPATELSEQISTAGTEASGTGCMKAVLNGGLLIGTLDGANIEIAEQVGKENLFIFGKTAEEIAALRAGGYDSRALINADPVLARVVETIGTLSGGIFQPVADMLKTADRYFHCADFASYVATQQRAAEQWQRADDWTRMSILNTARSGWFSGDRTVKEYADEIWKAAPFTAREPE